MCDSGPQTSSLEAPGLVTHVFLPESPNPLMTDKSIDDDYDDGNFDDNGNFDDKKLSKNLPF